MGMFDYVNYEAPCRKCGHILTVDNFQTKDHHQLLAVVKPKKIKNFYTSCPQCRTWNEYTVKIQIKIEQVKPPADEVLDNE